MHDAAETRKKPLLVRIDCVRVDEPVGLGGLAAERLEDSFRSGGEAVVVGGMSPQSAPPTECSAGCRHQSQTSDGVGNARRSRAIMSAMDLTYKIVRRLLRDDEVSFSRNKNFEAHEDPIVKRAVRIYRHLRSVEDDLLSADDGDVELQAVEREAERVTVRLSFPTGGGRRASFLSEQEWDLLTESDRVSDILERLLDEATEDTQNRLSNLA